MAGENKLGANSPGVGARGRGRPKGSPNKLTATIKDMILQALNDAHEDGGAAYLKQQAIKNPAAFLTLVGKVLPLQLTGEGGGPMQFEKIERLFIRPEQVENRPSIN